ncbi:MAG: hypothetical protein ACOCXT_04180 [Candidatus Dojkabacteria bacterium]
MSLLEQIKHQIAQQDLTPERYSEGEVIYYADGIATGSGLQSAGYSEIVKVFETQPSKNFVYGLVFNLEETQTGIIMLEESPLVKTGSRVITTGQVFQAEVSESYPGRMIDILGRPHDGQGKIIHTNPTLQKVDRKAYGVIDRQSVSVPLQTGIIAVDALMTVRFI